jgi:hypothetical protein
MNREKTKQSIKRLFDSFGKTNPNGDHVNAYLDWAKYYNSDLVDSVANTAIKYDDRFPSIARLNELAREEQPASSYMVDMGKEKCFNCNGTGLVPELLSPNKNNTINHINKMACNCSVGMNIKWTLPYFEKYPELQYKDRITKDSTRYDWIVDMVQRELNKALIEQNEK